MNVERGTFEGDETPEERAYWDARIAAAAEKARADSRFARLFEDDDDDEEAAIVRARSDLATGRTIPHEKVVDWLKTWGTPDEGPPPREWFE